MGLNNISSADLKQKIESHITIDTRSLGLFRIGIGVLMIVDIILRSRNFNRFYTDEGILPLEAKTELYGQHVSVFSITGDPTITGILFAIYFFLGVFVTIGYKTRLVMPLAFFFVISLDARNPMVLSYADIAYRVFMFWGLFMPLGERYSIDAIQSDSHKEQHSGIATLFILLQIITLYFSNGIHKLDYTREWLTGEAMYMIFQLDSITYLLAPHLTEFETLLQAGGIFWFTLMLISPFLLLTRERTRYLLASLYAGGHLFLAITVRIGAFPFVSITGLLLFGQQTLYNDGKKAIRKIGLENQFSRFYTIVTKIGEKIHSILLYRDYRSYIEIEQSTIDNIKLAGGAIAMSFALIMGAAIIAQNVEHTTDIEIEDPPQVKEDIDDVTRTLAIEQPSWKFYHRPVEHDYYKVVAAETESNETIDPYNDKNFSFERPHGKQNHKQYETYRDRFRTSITSNNAISDPENRTVFEPLASQYCDYSASESEHNISNVNIWVIEEDYSTENVHDIGSYNRTAVPITFYNCSGDEPTLIEEPPMDLENEINIPEKDT